MNVAKRLQQIERYAARVCDVPDALSPKQVEAQARKARSFDAVLNSIALEMAVVEEELAAIRGANTGGRTR